MPTTYPKPQFAPRSRSYRSDAALPDTLTSYYDRIRGTPAISAEEEQRLVRLAKTGDIPARNRLIESQLRWVVKFAHHYRVAAWMFEDLVAEGNLALVAAIDRFDPTRGTRLITAATYDVRHAMYQYLLRHTRQVRVPPGILSEHARLEDARHQLQGVMGRPPDSEELAEFVGLRPSRVGDVDEACRDEVSLDDRNNDVLQDECHDHQVESPAVAEMDAEAAKSMLDGALSSLDWREWAVIRGRYLYEGDGPRLYSELGEALGCSGEWARRIEATALTKLKSLVPGADGSAKFSEIFGLS